MTDSDKNASHDHDHDEGDKAVDDARSGRRDELPFHGVPHSEHPHDPFRNDFGSNSLKFEF